MPPVTTIPSEETDDADIPAFKVLNQDNLGPVGMVIGESIFKPFGRENQKQKPNIVVYPTRRSNGNLEETKNKTFTKSNGYISTQNKTNLKKNYSNSYGNLNQNHNHCNSAAKKRGEIEEKEQILDLNFTKTLDAKLRKLQKEEKIKKTKSASSTCAQNKPFITTVKKGTFLEPPLEVTSILRLNFEKKDGEKLYAYASRPRVLNRVSTASSNSDMHKAKCEAAAIAAAVIASGVAGYQSAHNRAKRDINSNISKKGLNTTNDTPQKTGNSISTITTGYTLATAIAERFFKRADQSTIGKVFGWKKGKDNQAVIDSTDNENDNEQENQKNNEKNTENNERDGSPLPYANIMFDRRVVRGNTYAAHPMPTCDAESPQSRQLQARRRALARRRAEKQKAAAQRLRLLSPPPVAGRKHIRVQTEKYLEELWERPPEADNCTQTDLFYDRPISPFYVPVKTGVDAETQIYPGDLFDFDMEVVPILEVLVGKTIEQALIEVLEEEELAALREQQRRFLEIRAAELAEAQRLEEQERRLRAERDRRVKDHEEGCKTQQETEERIAAAVLMQGYIADLLPSVLEGLDETGFLYDNIKHNIDQGFMPWLMKEVTMEMENMVSSRDVLTDIIKEILGQRAEIYRLMYAEHLEIEPGGEEEEDVDGMQDAAIAELELALHKEILESVRQEEAKKEEAKKEEPKKDEVKK